MSIAVKDASPMDRYRSSLKKLSMKATPQRLAVHEAMLNLGHACADQVAEWINDRGNTHITIASVYNILSQMALAGIYKHRMSLNNKMYFDVNTFKHIHLYDTENNVYKDVIDEELSAMVEAKMKGRGFRGYKVDSIDIQILCHPSKKTLSLKK